MKNPAAVALGRRGGAVRSAAKAEASRANGARGGRPSSVGLAAEAFCMCPTCGADFGVPCVWATTGSRRGKVHASRRAEYKRVNEAR